MCGSHNNIFSYKDAGSLPALTTAGSSPLTVLKNPEASICCQPCPVHYSESKCSDMEKGYLENVPSCRNGGFGCECQSGHPYYCECSKLIQIDITKLEVSINHASVATL